MSRYRVTIFGRDFEAMADLVRKYNLNLACNNAKKLSEGGYRVDAFATETQIEQLNTVGYTVHRHENADDGGRQRQAELRLAIASTGQVHGANVTTIGRYLTVDEIESVLASTAASNASFTQLLKLPNRTWEGRECHAIKLGATRDLNRNRTGVYFLGGIHAREWGSPDILLNFVVRLSEAYRNGTGITVGNKQYSATQIQDIIDTKDVYVFPQANPDGRAHSMNDDPDWRKNRRPAALGATLPECIGVDINRNYDFLWDFKKFFDPNAPVQNSTSACDHDVYIGPKAFSEPETLNVVWLLDNHPDIRYFIDLHSYSEDILYSWSDDDDQSTDPGMNFSNPAYDGKRGIANDNVYKEYIEPSDKAAVIKLATQMQGAIQAVRGKQYSVMQSMALYPTAGTSDDYAYSRHIVDKSKSKIYSYTVEWGSEQNPTPFHPPYAEMNLIIQEMVAGLLEFCSQAK